MSKRLQVLMDEPEYRAIRRIARQKGMTVAQWVRTALRVAARGEATGDPARKLQAVRRAASHEFPTGDIDQLLAEIERGYLG